MTRPTSLLVVDDEPAHVDALTHCVSAHEDLQLVGTATTVAEGLDLLGRTACDIVVLDHRMLPDWPSADAEPGSATTHESRTAPRVVLLVDSHADPRHDGGDLLDAIATGVCGWVDRAAGPEALVVAVRDVSRGESYLPTEQVQALLAARAARRRRTGPPDQGRLLTDRESAVLQALADGLSRAEIGASLQLSPNTVRTHVRSILRKYHVHSAPDVVALMTAEEPIDG